MSHTTYRPIPLADATVHVQPIGLGCMNLSHAYGVPPSFEQAQRLLLAALDAGVDFFDTAALYGFGANETLLGKVVTGTPSLRQKITLASKCGMTGVDVAGDGKLVRVINGRPEAIRQTIEDSLRRLQCDLIDLYYLHRWDKTVPIEDSVGALAGLVQAGKIRGIGLSEISATTLKKAHAVHPIAAVQSEYSLWSRNAEIAVLDTCRELGVAYVAFSPMARGLFGAVAPNPAVFDAKDIRLTMPRFNTDNYPHNLALHQRFVALCDAVSLTPARVALAWLLHQAPHIIPIPGTVNEAHLVENLAAAGDTLSPATLAALDALFTPKVAAGERYNAQGCAEVDTENFA